jgi:transglutaminase-like putative cysteine protease
MRRMLADALAIGAVLSVAQAAYAQMVPLFVIPTESRVTAAIPPSASARVELTLNDAAILADRLGVSAPAGAESFEYVIAEYPQLKAADSGRTWLESTWLIDYNEPAFAALKDEMAKDTQELGRAQIVAFVDRIVDEKVPRGWDLASTVARRREGDCSEHAVLTAALARLYGIPARVVVGVALVSDGKDFAAFGHAWAETLEDGKWVVADAAMRGFTQTVRYVPVGLIEDEGMGYSMGLAGLTRKWIRRVVVLGPGN